MCRIVVLKRVLIFLLLFNLHAPLSAQSDYDHISSGELIKATFKTWPQDFLGIAREPFLKKRKSLWISGITLGLMISDTPTQKFIQSKINPIFDWNIKPIPIISRITVGTRGLFGGATNGYLLVGLTGHYLTSLVLKHKKGQAAVLLTSKAIVTSYLVSHLFLKSVFARKRPYTPLDGPYPAIGLPKGFTTDPWDFGNFEWPSLNATREGAAFPSFHFTMYFAVSRVFYRIYDNAWWAYLIAAAGLLPDFDIHNHWTSDMFVGAIVGTLIGEVIYRNFLGSVLGSSDDTNKKSNLLNSIINKTIITPTFSNQNAGVSLIIQL